MRKFNRKDASNMREAVARWAAADAHPNSLVTASCNLCNTYSCHGRVVPGPTCPVLEVTGRAGCDATHFRDYVDAWPNSEEEALAISDMQSDMQAVLTAVNNNLEE